MRSAALLLAALLSSSAAAAAPARNAPPSSRPATFEELLGALTQAEARADQAAVARAMADIRRARIERNVDSHPVLGLAFVRDGVIKLGRGDRDGAEQAFRGAVALAPGLPDAHFGLATALLRKGVLGLLPSVKATAAGVAAYLGTTRGQVRAFRLATASVLLCGFALAWTLALVLLLRRGGLLKHDIEESLAAAGRRMLALPLLVGLALLPVVLLQGWGWLPLWWLALLFVYFSLLEKAAATVAVLGTLAVGPAATALEYRLQTLRNPLFGAALAAIEAAPAPGDLAVLERAARESPGDLDLQYLLAAACKRSGRYEEAADIYRRVLEHDAGDPYARNNLANVDFTRGGFDAALARYKAGTEGARSPEVAATSYYNLSLAYLQKFDYQAFNEARSNADRLAPRLVADYDRWKYDSGDYAVVDLGLSPSHLWAKLGGHASGPGLPGVAQAAAAAGGQGFDLRGALRGRFAAALVLLTLVPVLLGRFRGRKVFTTHCGKCGAAFCRLCQLGHAGGNLCSPCYHLYVVRDGVSGPARNRKMAEVQRAESRRNLLFRGLSVLAPGAGQIYAGRTLAGVVLLGAWYAVLSLALASRIVPLTDVSSELAPPWLLAAGGLVLLVVWLLANRYQPEFEVQLPLRRTIVRRTRAAQGA